MYNPDRNIVRSAIRRAHNKSSAYELEVWTICGERQRSVVVDFDGITLHLKNDVFIAGENVTAVDIHWI